MTGHNPPEHRDFAKLRYAQCWEDADVLLEALDIQPGDTCLSIGSAGDNTLSMLTRHPGRVIAIDLSAAQLACLQLRVAAYRCLDHDGLLELIGSRPSTRRTELYRQCRAAMSDPAQTFWDAYPHDVRRGIGDAGRFESYLRTFRRCVVPLIHRRRTVERLLEGDARDDRERFYEQVWNNRRWRWLFGLFFSRLVMGRLGRSPALFYYVEGPVAERLLARTRHALVELNPADNPYLQWILTGRHVTALPHALRPENFQTIRANLDRLEWRQSSLEDALADRTAGPIRRFNLSDVFEYLSPQTYQTLLGRVADRAAPGARLAYWNMLAPRTRPAALAGRLVPLDDPAARLHAEDKAFFYSRFVVEQVRA